MLDPTSSAPLPEPLRLPRGSVRGLLALALIVTFGYLGIRAIPVEPVVVNAVIVVVAFYFGSAGLQTTAGTPAAPRAGRWIVRGLFLLGFGGLAAWFLKDNPSLAALPPGLFEVWQVLGGYVLGLSLSWLLHRKADISALRRRATILFRDVSAIGAIAGTAVICAAFATQTAGGIVDRAEDLLSLIITYYFGSRVSGH